MSNKELIREIREQNPDAVPSHIAQALGISRERVRQLLNGMGLPTSMQLPAKQRLCPCGDPAGKGRVYCSDQCRRAAHLSSDNYETMTCPTCKVEFSKSRKKVAWQRARGQVSFYCSVPCRPSPGRIRRGGASNRVIQIGIGGIGIVIPWVVRDALALEKGAKWKLVEMDGREIRIRFEEEEG